MISWALLSALHSHTLPVHSLGMTGVNRMAKKKTSAKRVGHMEKNDRENAATLPAVPTAASTAKQSRKRETKLEKATNKKKLDGARRKIRVNICVALQQWLRWLRVLA